MVLQRIPYPAGISFPAVFFHIAIRPAGRTARSILFGLFLLCIAFSSSALALQPAQAPVIEAHVVRSMPHRVQHFTQGLFFAEGQLYESAGGDASALYRLNPQNGAVLAKIVFPGVFLEGSAMLDGVIHVLTWRNHKRYTVPGRLFSSRPGDRDELPIKTFPLPGEGWGLCSDGEKLWMSDGSARLSRWQAHENGSWSELGSLLITDNGQMVEQLNELEYINGFIFANVWMSPRIAIIDPHKADADSRCPVAFWLDCTALSKGHAPIHADTGLFTGDNVLNGIAWDENAQRLLITGKRWSHFYEITLPEEICGKMPEEQHETH